MTASSRDHEPLSWQQEGRLRRDHLRGERVPNIVAALPLPDELTDDAARQRLERMVAREDSLRIVELSLEEGLRYADTIDLPFRCLEVSSEAGLQSYLYEESFAYFERGGGPLWSATLVTCRAGPAGPARYLCGSFDHLITDGLSQLLFANEMIAPAPESGAGAGSHREWARWQRSTYPKRGRSVAPSHEFWRQYLDGTEPDRALDLSFCRSPNGELSGVVHSLRQAAPVPASRLRQAAARVRTTPFVLFLGAVAHVAVSMGADQDLTLRVNTIGRSQRYLDTQGYFADNLPVRLRGAGLGHPLAAVQLARSSWLSTVPHQSTPWDFLLAEFGAPGDVIERRPAQGLVNFLPWEQPSHGVPPEQSVSEYPAHMGTFQVVGMMYDDDTCRLECEFDPARFAVDGGVEFLAVLSATLEQLCARLLD